ncbi:MAG: hypothetical protein MK236_09615, partial [Pedosphaera sp.]|nr:hypothetical protein [Pedosphaera sp.]
MSEEKSSPIGIIIIVVAAVIITGCASGKSTYKGKIETPPEPPKYDLKKGLVAYYPFNGNAKDESGNGNDGEVKGATLAKDRHGEDEKTYSFDGQDDYILVPDSDSLDFGTGVDGWTISCWVNHRGPNRTKRLGGLIIAKHNRDGSPGV